MNPRRPKHERLRRWLVLAGLVVVVPKCLACVWVWLGLAALLGLGPEICGGALP